jgi:glutathione S-transferase
MITVYAFSTPNSVRVPILLEELQLEYEIKPVNVRKGEQKSPEFLALNPNGKVPVLVDSQGPGVEDFTLTESGAILIDLAEKTGRLLPADVGGRARVFEQLFFQATGIGPAFGQAGFFKRQAPEQYRLRSIDSMPRPSARSLCSIQCSRVDRSPQARSTRSQILPTTAGFGAESSRAWIFPAAPTSRDGMKR